jgi:YidC/Oxa1 family membrane protein insertase
MIEHKNTILAIVLSLIVVVGWNFFIAKPQIERQQREAQLKQQEQTQLQQPQAQPGGHPANGRAIRAGRSGRRRSTGHAKPGFGRGGGPAHSNPDPDAQRQHQP